MSQAWENYARGKITEDSFTQTMKNILKNNILNLYPTRATKIDLLTNHRDNLITELSKKGVSVEDNKTIIKKICDELLAEVKETEETLQYKDLDRQIGEIKQNLVGSTSEKLELIKQKIQELDTLNAMYKYLSVKLQQELIEDDAFYFHD